MKCTVSLYGDSIVETSEIRKEVCPGFALLSVKGKEVISIGLGMGESIFRCRKGEELVLFDVVPDILNDALFLRAICNGCVDYPGFNKDDLKLEYSDDDGLPPAPPL